MTDLNENSEQNYCSNSVETTEELIVANDDDLIVDYDLNVEQINEVISDIPAKRRSGRQKKNISYSELYSTEKDSKTKTKSNSKFSLITELMQKSIKKRELTPNSSYKSVKAIKSVQNDYSIECKPLSVEELTEHKNMYVSTRPFRCDICDAKCNKCFKTQTSLDEHKRLFHSGTGSQSSNASSDKANSDWETKAVYLNKNVKPFECDICNESFYTDGCLNKHISTVHRIASFECDLCVFKAFTTNSIISHKRRNHSKVAENIEHSSNPCKQCELSFDSVLSLAKHMSDKHKYFKCNSCEFRTMYKNLLGRHKALRHQRPKLV